MRRIFIFAAFLLTGCASSPVLPDKSGEVQEFILPPEVVVEEQVIEPQVFDFAGQNFPDNCDWVDYIRTVDGDTIEIEEKVKIRFVGIDTPETKHPSKPIQPWGPEASAKTKEVLAGSEQVCLIADNKDELFDKYGRRLAYVFSTSGVDLNAELLKLGLARGYYWFPFSRADEFRQYEREAKAVGMGIWGK